jgi:tRNA nucleotidyltransferase/poly(A) polymerase
MSWHDDLLKRFPALAILPPGAFVVGGAIRDLHLGLDPADADVTSPDALACARSLGRKVITLGTHEHLSAYRVVDGQHVYDFAPLLDNDIDRDLARRDFTMNAMAVELATGDLLDPHDGRGDLQRRLVRMIDASNFDDDPLRMLKAVRMAVKYRFDIDPATLDAIRARADAINAVAAERVAYELNVIFSSNAFRRALALLHETRLDAPLGIEVREFRVDDVPLAAAYALLLRDVRAFAERFRWSESLLRDVMTLQSLVDDHSLLALYDAGELVARQLLPLLRALDRDDRILMPDFSKRALLSGNEIASLAGEKPGPRIGEIKRALLDAELRDEVNTRDEAEQFVREYTAGE